MSVTATHRGTSHHWEYDNFEGRTSIAPDIAAAFGLETERAGPATINESVTVYGRIVPQPEAVRRVSARFDGVIERILTSPVDGLDNYAEMIRLLVEDKTALKVYVNVAEE